MKLWDKGFEIDGRIERFTVGKDRELDLMLAPFDVLGTMAHVRMLESRGLLSGEELSLLLPELQAISESMPDNAQLIGIVGDVKHQRSDEYIEALTLTEKNSITYINLIADSSMKFMDNIIYVPTTVLVDSEGNVIGEPIIGSEVEKYKKALADYLNK